MTDLETADLPHCSLTWGRAQTAGFYSMQQKAKTRQLLNWQQHIHKSPSLLYKPLRMPLNRGWGFKAPAPLSVHCEVCSGAAAKEEPPEGWIWPCQQVDCLHPCVGPSSANVQTSIFV